MGGKSRKKQAAAMNEMNELAQEQFDYQKAEQGKQQIVLDAQKEQYKNFEFKNDFADLTNPYANIQTEFDNVYAGAKNSFAGAENAFAGMDNAYAGLDNKYEGMENRFEDMTVDMRAADFQAQQGGQQRANIMQGLRGAAGSSGIAGLAQSLANAGSMQSQQISAGIGQQERQNQMMSAQEGSRIDQMQRGAGMQLQQLQASGAMANQQAERQGAMQQQNMQMQGAAQQQQMILGGEAQARAMGVQQQNIQAQGQGQTDIMIAQGEANVQAAEFGQQSTILGMEYGQLTGANASLSSAMGNQMSGYGMEANMYGSNAQNTMSTIGNVAIGVATAKAAFLCIPRGTKVDGVSSDTFIEDIKPGDIIVGYSGKPVKVLQKHEYLEDPVLERFYKVKFDNGSIVNTCDMHKIKGVAAKDITENVISKEVYNGVEFSYDLLTEDAGYRISGIPVNSMIEEMAEYATKLKNN